MNHAKIGIILANAPTTDADEIWRKHNLLCAFDDERCDHVEEMIDALVSHINGLEEKHTEALEEQFKAGQEEAEERLTDEHEAKVAALEEQLDEARKLSEVDRKTEAIALGRREMEEYFLTRLREAMAAPAKELRANVNAIVVETIKRLNEP